MEFGTCEELNAIELSTSSNQAAGCDALGNQSHAMEGPELDSESSHCVNGEQKTSQAPEPVSAKVDTNFVPIKPDTQAVNVLNGEYCGLFTQLSIDYVDIFEILREEILAAEARELEVDGLLNAASEEEPEQSVGVEGAESTSVTDSKVVSKERGDWQGEAHCSFHNNETDVADMALIPQKGEVGQAELPCSPSPGLVKVALLKGVVEMGAEDKAVPAEDDKVGREDLVKLADVRDAGLAQDNRVAEEVKRVESSTTPALEHTPQHEDKVDHEEALPHPDVKVNGDAFSKEEDTGKVKAPLLDSHEGNDGDHLMQNDASDKLSEHSEDDEYTSSPFSGPIAFSGMLSYSGRISYSGQIPHSGNMSLHSDSSTSTRSFAFPILASDWNSSPAKIGPLDRRYFRRRRKWRLRFCCRRPATLFD